VQLLEVSGVVRLIYGSLGVKGLSPSQTNIQPYHSKSSEVYVSATGFSNYVAGNILSRSITCSSHL